MRAMFFVCDGKGGVPKSLIAQTVAEGHCYEDLAAALTREGLPAMPNLLRAYLTGGGLSGRPKCGKGRGAKPRHEAVLSTSPAEDQRDSVDLGHVTTEATAHGKPVIATVFGR